MAPRQTKTSLTEKLSLSKTGQQMGINIGIENHFDAKIYTNGSAIRGHATLTPPVDLPFEKIAIDLLGTSTISMLSVERDTISYTTTFLKLNYPLPETSLPESQIFSAQSPINLPFAFVIPYSLPSLPCKHEAHHQLPPSTETWEKNDQSPGCARIDYTIRVRVLLKADKASKKKKPLEASHLIRVLPTTTFEMPLLATPTSGTYRTACNKRIRNGSLFSPKSGSLKIAASEPAVMFLSTETFNTSDATVTATLEFVTKSKTASPPHINVKSAHLQSFTYFSPAHMDCLPDQAGSSPVFPFTTSKRVTIHQQEHTKWKQEAQSDDDSKRIKYTASLSLSFSQPDSQNTLLLPSFYSCLIARTYTLRLTLAPESSINRWNLDIPLQVFAGSFGDSPVRKLPKYTQIGVDSQAIYADVLPPYER